jgi:c(7)-type cytochrome triheme protein
VIIAGPKTGKLPPVAFDHWLHRAKYTCRLCHVELGFAMVAGTSGITRATIESGDHCGACHDGKRTSGGAPIFAACDGQPPRLPCARCHSVGLFEKPLSDFTSFTERWPKEHFGNGVDWDQAEQEKLYQAADSLEAGRSTRRPMTAPPGAADDTRLKGNKNILFSHAKHSAWSGCEGCHPALFPSVSKTTRYPMSAISAGKLCGRCHNTVAFPSTDCQRCHDKAEPAAAP